jgi:hypothetical protein
MKKGPTSSPFSAVCVVFLVAIAFQAAHASTATLNFTSTGGSVTDANGTDTGFTTRLSGTDTTSDDPDLLLDTTGSGTLDITNNSGADFNGQANMAGQEAPGIDLASLGFTGTQAFTITAVFNGAPANAFNNFAQYGVYVGTSSSNMTRDGFVYANVSDTLAGTQFFGNINASGADEGDTFSAQPTFATSDTLTVTISRAAGVDGAYTETVNGFNVNPGIDPNTILSGDLTAGVFSSNSDNSDSFVLGLDSFTATVDAPEPGTWAMLLGGLAMLVAFRRLCSRNARV